MRASQRASLSGRVRELGEANALSVVSDQITIEAGSAAASPIVGGVVLSADAGAGRAQKCVLVGIDDNADVARPDDEVPGLRGGHAAELRQAGEDGFRGRIRIIQTGIRQQLVDEVGAVGTAVDGTMVNGEIGKGFAFGAGESMRRGLGSRMRPRVGGGKACVTAKQE